MTIEEIIAATLAFDPDCSRPAGKGRKVFLPRPRGDDSIFGEVVDCYMEGMCWSYQIKHFDGKLTDWWRDEFHAIPSGRWIADHAAGACTVQADVSA